MDIWTWLAWILVIVGLVGTFLPVLPGGALIMAGGVVFYIAHPDGPLSVWTLVALVVLGLAGLGIDWAATFVSAKWFGAATLSIWLGVIGGIIGLFFGPIGILVGPLIGVFAGELFSGKSFNPALKSTIGTLLGTGGGYVMKALVSIVMAVWFAWDVLR